MVILFFEFGLQISRSSKHFFFFISHFSVTSDLPVTWQHNRPLSNASMNANLSLLMNRFQFEFPIIVQLFWLYSIFLFRNNWNNEWRRKETGITRIHSLYGSYICLTINLSHFLWWFAIWAHGSIIMFPHPKKKKSKEKMKPSILYQLFNIPISITIQVLK